LFFEYLWPEGREGPQLNVLRKKVKGPPTSQTIFLFCEKKLGGPLIEERGRLNLCFAEKVRAPLTEEGGGGSTYILREKVRGPLD
jgi:hypothetical protein